MTHPFSIERTYHVPVQKVWQAITDREQLKKWYFDLPAFRPEVGYAFQFYGEGKNGEKYLHLCRITEIITEKKLAHTWEYEGMEGITTVTFELFPDGDSTRLKLTHEGLETLAGNGPDFAAESFAAGWTMIIGNNLKEFIEQPQ
ncbi:MAG: SRPBCC domain-containing protein [Ferruginibacter sp.]